MLRFFSYNLPLAGSRNPTYGGKIYMHHIHKRMSRDLHPSPLSVRQGVWPLYDTLYYHKRGIGGDEVVIKAPGLMENITDLLSLSPQ